MAKSRVATNRNLSITLTMLEQKNCLVYAIDHGVPSTVMSSDEDTDGNIRLSKFLRRRLNKSRPPDAVETSVTPNINSSVNCIIFCGPSKVRKLTTYERMCLKSFFWDGEDELLHYNGDAYDEDIPTCCRIFRSASYNTTHRGDPYPFKVTSSTLKRSNQSRSTSFVRFETYKMVNGREERSRRQSHFGEVLLFFTIDLPEGCATIRIRQAAAVLQPSLRLAEKERGPVRGNRENELLLAYVRHFPVQRDGRLLYRDGEGTLSVIMARDIHELVGLLNKGKKQYVVRKHTALF